MEINKNNAISNISDSHDRTDRFDKTDKIDKIKTIKVRQQEIKEQNESGEEGSSEDEKGKKRQKRRHDRKKRDEENKEDEIKEDTKNEIVPDFSKDMPEDVRKALIEKQVEGFFILRTLEVGESFGELALEKYGKRYIIICMIIEIIKFSDKPQ